MALFASGHHVGQKAVVRRSIGGLAVPTGRVCRLVRPGERRCDLLVAAEMSGRHGKARQLIGCLGKSTRAELSVLEQDVTALKPGI